MDTSQVVVERREYRGRRAFSWHTMLSGYTRSRRRVLRRAEDVDGIFIDWHHPWLFFLALGIMILSCLDAFMTLQLINRGMWEANPVMAAALDQGIGTFVACKVTLTGASIMILVFFARTLFLNRLRTGVLLTIFFSVYCCLVCYEIVHLLQLS